MEREGSWCGGDGECDGVERRRDGLHDEELCACADGADRAERERPRYEDGRGFIVLICGYGLRGLRRGVNGAMTAANNADGHALAAGAAADQANASAQIAANRVDSLTGVVANLDQYKPLADVSVTFGFDKAVLTAADKAQLDGIANSLTTTRGYILQVTGGTDSVGNAEYNYALSQRRADAVVSYLAVKYNVPPHKFYLVGIGKDVQVASDKTAAGRAKNRRVDVQVLSNRTTTADTGAAGAMR